MPTASIKNPMFPAFFDPLVLRNREKTGLGGQILAKSYDIGKLTKPKIRSVARIGDWVVGTGSKARGRENHAVFAMHVTGPLTFEQYWVDPRFQDKKPNLRGSIKQSFGDNIYSKNAATGTWRQADSHHSLEDGTPNASNVEADTGTDRMLFSDDFVYWGGSGPSLPAPQRVMKEMK